jgi:hypothetical protein
LVSIPIGISIGIWHERGMPFVVIVCTILATALVSAIVSMAMFLGDILHQRMREERRVNAILRLYFTLGALSMVVWTVTAIGLTLLVIYVLTVFEI